MTLSTEGTCVDHRYRRRMAKRLKTNEEKKIHEPGGERNVLGVSDANRVPFSEQNKSHIDAPRDSSASQPLDIVKALIMAADNDMPELNREFFTRTPSANNDAEAFEPIFEESELPPRPVKHKKKKFSFDGKSSKHPSSDNKNAETYTEK
ncbi:hypothetical protein MAR_013064 [Mya arenaria]|uniref:Uncharacterized protein n=1 Tax=Mya arenaria TaxID=6604 RepID=A0ABY7FZH0_MYAAR|nr:uncharacterized protein LOC128220282 [Mya arenaria]XP_052784581.1 uncharacterized protein LOC128220282 [Mya arenaria]WAR27360.1 hypothetical protein MAR_013064 [Mya arenaria]